MALIFSLAVFCIEENGGIKVLYSVPQLLTHADSQQILTHASDKYFSTYKRFLPYNKGNLRRC
jgi:hypothetical protein